MTPSSPAPSAPSLTVSTKKPTAPYPDPPPPPTSSTPPPPSSPPPLNLNHDLNRNPPGSVRPRAGSPQCSILDSRSSTPGLRLSFLALLIRCHTIQNSKFRRSMFSVLNVLTALAIFYPRSSILLFR